MKILEEHIEKAAGEFADLLIKKMKSGELDIAASYTFLHGYFLDGKRIVPEEDVRQFAKEYWRACVEAQLAEK